MTYIIRFADNNNPRLPLLGAQIAVKLLQQETPELLCHGYGLPAACVHGLDAIVFAPLEPAIDKQVMTTILYDEVASFTQQQPVLRYSQLPTEKPFAQIVAGGVFHAARAVQVAELQRQMREAGHECGEADAMFVTDNDRVHVIKTATRAEQRFLSSLDRPIFKGNFAHEARDLLVAMPDVPRFDIFNV